MAIIGVTGGIGSGKSTICSFLGALLQAEIFDTDRIAKETLAHDEVVREAVKREISPQAFGKDGLPDRDLLRRMIFKNPLLKVRLEEILHPRVRAAWLAKSEEVRSSGGHFIVDIPLLYENGAEVFFDMVVVVGCAADTQLHRACARGLAREQVEAIMRTQMPTLEKVARADLVVWNDGSLLQLEAQAKELAMRLGDKA